MDVVKTNKTELPGYIALISIGCIVIILVLLIFYGPASYTVLSQRIDEYNKSKKVEDIMTRKLATLKNARVDLLNRTPQSVIALPDKNAALTLISQIKQSSTLNNVVLTDISSGDVTAFDQNSTKLTLNITLEGADYQSIVKTLTDLASRAPLTTIDLVEMEGAVTKTAKVHVSTYWAALPTTLPANDQPLSGLTQDDVATLDILSNLIAPQFDTLTPQKEAGRDNPFN